MKQRLTPFFLLLLILALAVTGFAQPALRDFYYVDDGIDPAEPPFRSLCGGQGTILEDGTAQVCLFWDANGNGPDPSDVQPTQDTSGCEFCVNYNCFAINGEAQGAGAGYFVTSSSIVLYTIPDSAFYYWRINVDIGGDVCCWTSSVYTFTPGWQEIYMTAADWTCVTGACPITLDPPTPPVNVDASVDSRCIGISVTWIHDGLNVSGFSIYDQDGLLSAVAGTARGEFVPINDELVHNIYVLATNAGGSSDTSNIDAGSTYMLHFADGPAGNVYGDNLSGDTVTVWFQRPEDLCPSRSTVLIIDANNQEFATLCVDSLVDSVTCTLPNGNATNLRLVLEAYSFDRFITLTDTSDSTFHLGIVAADDRPLLIPDHFDLAQNFPNPFNPTTNIEFSVPYQSDVKIEVYNITGQLVKTLVDGSITAGIHRIAWDGFSNNGVSVSSGLYFYRMSGPGFVQTKKMLMLK